MRSLGELQQNIEKIMKDLQDNQRIPAIKNLIPNLDLIKKKSPHTHHPTKDKQTPVSYKIIKPKLDKKRALISSVRLEYFKKWEELYTKTLKMQPEFFLALEYETFEDCFYRVTEKLALDAVSELKKIYSTEIENNSLVKETFADLDTILPFFHSFGLEEDLIKFREFQQMAKDKQVLSIRHFFQWYDPIVHLSFGHCFGAFTEWAISLKTNPPVASAKPTTEFSNFSHSIEVLFKEKRFPEKFSVDYLFAGESILNSKNFLYQKYTLNFFHLVTPFSLPFLCKSFGDNPHITRLDGKLIAKNIWAIFDNLHHHSADKPNAEHKPNAAHKPIVTVLALSLIPENVKTHEAHIIGVCEIREDIHIRLRIFDLDGGEFEFQYSEQNAETRQKDFIEWVSYYVNTKHMSESNPKKFQQFEILDFNHLLDKAHDLVITLEKENYNPWVELPETILRSKKILADMDAQSTRDTAARNTAERNTEAMSTSPTAAGSGSNSTGSTSSRKTVKPLLRLRPQSALGSKPKPPFMCYSSTARGLHSHKPLAHKPLTCRANFNGNVSSNTDTNTNAIANAKLKSIALGTDKINSKILNKSIYK